MNMRIVLTGLTFVVLGFTACGGASPTPSPAQTPAPAAGGAAAAAPQNPAPAAAPKPAAPVRLDMTMVKTFFGTEPMAPKVDNPLTPEKVALGKLLYHDESLSKMGNMSCATCHDLGNYGVDNLPTSPGSDGSAGKRNTPTTYNAFRNYAQFWDARAQTVEEQAMMPMLNPIEHGIADEAELVAKMKAKPALAEGFAKAFPGETEPVSAKNFGLAVGAFERTLVTTSRFDKFLDGDQKALTNEEKLGLDTFMKVGCQQCHMTRLLGGNMMQKLGVYKPYPTEDGGRMAVTNSESDKHLFKVSSLLNVAKTAPYYHDGKVATLAEAVRNMAEIQLNKSLTNEQVDSIVTFLEALTGELPAEFAKAK